MVDRDINAAINIKRLGLDVFPRIKCCRGKPVIVSSVTNSTLMEVLNAFQRIQKPILTLTGTVWERHFSTAPNAKSVACCAAVNP